MFCIISLYYSFYNNKFQRSTYYSLFLSIIYRRRLGLNLPDSLPFFVFCIISPYYSFYNYKFQHSTYFSSSLSILCIRRLGLKQGCQTHFSSRATWRQIFLKRAGSVKKVSFLKKNLVQRNNVPFLKKKNAIKKYLSFPKIFFSKKKNPIRKMFNNNNKNKKSSRGPH